MTYIPATASGFSYPGYPPSAATDGNDFTFWTFGTLAPASIDFWFPAGVEYSVSSLQVTTAMAPGGFADHIAYGRKKDGGWTYIGTIAGYLADSQWIPSTPNSDMTNYVGITLYTDVSPSWVAWREVRIVGQQWTDPPPLPAGVLPPVQRGDVVSRDLTVPWPANNLGHIAVFDGVNVLQAMNEGTPMQSVSWDNFRLRDIPWPTIFTNIPDHTIRSCWRVDCVFDATGYFNFTVNTYEARRAISDRARQIVQIGGEYTLTTSVRMAVPRMYEPNGSVWTQAKPGMYRCDTFVMDAFQYSDVWAGQEYMDPFTGNYIGYPVRRTTVDEMQPWRDKIHAMIWSPGWTPVQLYNRLKSF